MKKFLTAVVVIFVAPFAQSESEPNDGPSDAESLVFGYPMDGTLKQDDEDWFSIDVPAGAMFEVVVDGDAVGGVDYCYLIYRDDIWDASYDAPVGNGRVKNIPSIRYLRAPSYQDYFTYFIVVWASMDCWSQFEWGGDYKVTVNSLSTTDFDVELERNDWWEGGYPNPVQFGRQMQGDLASSQDNTFKDRDVFLIEVPSSGKLSVDIFCSYETITFRLTDRDGNTLVDGDYLGAYQNVAVSAGDYFLDFSNSDPNGNFTRGWYDFTAYFEPDSPSGDPGPGSPSGDSGNVFQLILEEPVNADTASGISNVRGWAVATQGIEKVELFVDGQYVSEIPFGGQRFDVEGVFPSVRNSVNSGFGQTFNYSQLSEGAHSITVRAYATDGSVQESSAVFQVAKFPAEFIPSGQDPDSSNSQVSVDGGNGDITIRNVVQSSGESYEVRLRWKSASQGYEIIQVRRQ